jgi:hypothetical protein
MERPTLTALTVPSLVERGRRVWDQFWFAEIPPHIYALIRIALGTIGVINLLALHDVAQFWQPGGFVSEADSAIGLKPWLAARGAGDVAGGILYLGVLAIFGCVAVGFATSTTVALGLIAALFQLSWNYLPLSGANHAFQAFLFCLMWADCGSVWSLDAFLSRRRAAPAATTVERFPIAPLRLIQIQVAVIYLNTGLWKLMSPLWRDGTAVHYVLQSNVFRRVPIDVPVSLDALTTLATYATLLFEIAFIFLIPFRQLRRFVLIGGVLLHLGMLALIEIGPFHIVMMAGYLAFLDPERVPTFSALRLRQPAAVEPV